MPDANQEPVGTPLPAEFVKQTPSSTTVFGACNDARWLGPLHVTMTAIEVNREHSE